MLNAGLQPVREDDEVAPLNSYLRWLPCCYNPGKDRRRWYTQLMFAPARGKPVAGVGPCPGYRASRHHDVQPRRRADHLRSAQSPGPADERPPVLLGPTGSGKVGHAQQSAEPGRPFIGRALHRGSRQCFGFVQRLRQAPGPDRESGQAGPGSGISLAPFADARRLIETPSDVQTLDADALDEDLPPMPQPWRRTNSATCWANWRSRRGLMITGGEDKEEARMTRADRC